MRASRPLALSLVLVPLALLAAAGCGGGPAAGPSPEVQKQNVDDELKAMENAKQPPRSGRGKATGI
jgi:hypothetical protein